VRRPFPAARCSSASNRPNAASAASPSSTTARNRARLSFPRLAVNRASKSPGSRPPLTASRHRGLPTPRHRGRARLFRPGPGPRADVRLRPAHRRGDRRVQCTQVHHVPAPVSAIEPLKLQFLGIGRTTASGTGGPRSVRTYSAVCSAAGLGEGCLSYAPGRMSGAVSVDPGLRRLGWARYAGLAPVLALGL
jgi:hypothetical protein